MVTPRQMDALLSSFENGNPWVGTGANGRKFARNHGGAYRRMVDGMVDDGLLYRKEEDGGKPHTPTAKGLEAILARATKRKEADLIFAASSRLEKARKIEAAVAQARAEAKEQRDYENRRRAIERRVARVMGFREFFREEVEGFRDVANPVGAAGLSQLVDRLTDDELLEFVDRIVSKEMTL